VNPELAGGNAKRVDTCDQGSINGDPWRGKSADTIADTQPVGRTHRPFVEPERLAQRILGYDQGPALKRKDQVLGVQLELLQANFLKLFICT